MDLWFGWLSSDVILGKIGWGLVDIFVNSKDIGRIQS